MSKLGSTREVTGMYSPPVAEPQPTTAGRDIFAEYSQTGSSLVSESPVSTFAADVDTACYTIARRWNENGSLPPAASVRPEEYINAFDYALPGPELGETVASQVSYFPTPWNANTMLLEIQIQGTKLSAISRPAVNLVFLLDTSGSMAESDKLPLLVSSLKASLSELREGDQVAIVTYAGSAGLELEPTDATDRASIEAALNWLGAGGSTAGQSGLEQAYATARSMMGDGEVTRVILGTDGDFNVGRSSPKEMTEFISKKRESVVYLSVWGFVRETSMMGSCRRWRRLGTALRRISTVLLKE